MERKAFSFPRSEFGWCRDSELRPGNIVKEYNLYSKVSTRTLVAYVRKYEIVEVTADTVVAKDVRVMYMVKSNGVLSWKYGQLWGFRIDSDMTRYNYGYGQKGRSMSHEFCDLSYELGLYLGKWANRMLGEYTGNDVRWSRFNPGEYLSAIWVDMNYPGISHDDIMCMLDLFGSRKKPVLREFSYQDMINTAIGQLKTKSDRKLASKLMQMEIDRYSREDDGLFQSRRGRINGRSLAQFASSMLEVVRIVKSQKGRQFLLANWEAGLHRENWKNVDKFFDMFPSCSSTEVSTNRFRGDVSYINDAMRQINKMNKVEKAMVGGSTVKKIHDNASNIYSRFTYHRTLAQKEAKLKNFKYPDWVMSTSTDMVKAAGPAVLNTVGAQMKICVGSYTSRVSARQIAIFISGPETRRFCLEVDLDNKGEKMTLIQAKLDCNKHVATDPEVYAIVKKWCEDNDVTINCYDMDPEHTGYRSVDRQPLERPVEPMVLPDPEIVNVRTAEVIQQVQPMYVPGQNDYEYGIPF